MHEQSMNHISFKNMPTRSPTAQDMFGQYQASSSCTGCDMYFLK